MQRNDNENPQLEDSVVYCEKCKKIGLFEEMSPYGHKWWFTYSPYRHKDCGGTLCQIFDNNFRHMSAEKWKTMSQEEKNEKLKEYREVLARIEQSERESEARMNAMSYEERKALDKEISDFRKYNDPNLTCPMCGSHVVKKLTVADRAVSVAAWGLASGKIGKQYECKKCGHKW